MTRLQMLIGLLVLPFSVSAQEPCAELMADGYSDVQLQITVIDENERPIHGVSVLLLKPEVFPFYRNSKPLLTNESGVVLIATEASSYWHHVNCESHSGIHLNLYFLMAEKAGYFTYMLDLDRSAEKAIRLDEAGKRYELRHQIRLLKSH